MSEPKQPRPAVPATEADATPAAHAGEVVQPTEPVGAVPGADPAAAEPVRAPAPAGRPSAPRPRPGPLTMMGPWAPVAGALLGLLVGVVGVLLLRGAAHDYSQRLSLVLLVVGLTMLGAAGPLLADEVRMLRRGLREAAVRPGFVEATAGLLNGLTPARWLLLISAFVLFLAAYVGR